jgi:hypothetical protein
VSRAIWCWAMEQKPLTALQQHVLQQYPRHGIKGCLRNMPGRKSCDHNGRRDVRRAIKQLRKMGLLAESECS